jgi:hypothetical protein
VAYLIPIIVPTIENAFVNNTLNIFDQVDPIICVSLFVTIAAQYNKVVTIPTPIITAKAHLTIIFISSFWLFFKTTSKSFNALSISISIAFFNFCEFCNSIVKFSVSSSIFFLLFTDSLTSVAILTTSVMFPLLSRFFLTLYC